MIYKVKVTGYVIVEADDPYEARERAEDEDYIEKSERFGSAVPVEYDEDSGQYVEAKRERERCGDD
jgi:hypothetical protein